MILHFLELYWRRIVTAFGIHLLYVLVSVAIAFVIALALGILLSRIPRWANVILPVLSVLQTIPGIVFIGVLFLYNGMVPSTVIFALATYAVFPILKNTFVGLIEVPAHYKEAAQGCGMSPVQVLWRIELPLAMPVIFSGLRMSTVYTVSWAVLAAMIGLGGLGDLIYSGISSNNNMLTLAGAIPAAVMAMLLSLLIDLLRRCVIPRSLRRDAS
ncbi:MAG: ABC transporter permease [Oscillospiraceae bacterium]|nr:ABC transporter permease [Oscillospiraceae bacterium]